MFQRKFYYPLLVLAVLLCALSISAVSAPSAHAAGVPGNSTKTQVVHASESFCNFLKRSDPAHAEDPHICDLKIVSTDTYTPRKTNGSITPNGACGVYNNNHKFSVTGVFNSWGFSQTTDFYWNGSCGAPSILSHDCSDLWATAVFTVSPDRCIQYPNGSGHTQAEDDIFVSSMAGGTFIAHAYSDGLSDTEINDWSN